MKRFNLKALAVLMVGMAAFTGSTSAAITLHFGYEAPCSDTQHEAAKKFNDLLKEKTKREIKLSLFSDSILGNTQTMISAVRGGTIDLEMSDSPNFSGIVPKLNVIDIPFIFQSCEHAYAVLDSETDQDLLKKLETQGLKSLAFWEVGFCSFTNSKHPVKTPDDIKGLKVRTNQNPMYIQTFSILGTNSVPMPLSELYIVFETRAVDAQEHPVGIVWSTKLYEVKKYLSLTNHSYTPLIVVMNKAKFDTLSPALPTTLVEAAQEVGVYQHQLNLENGKGIIEKMQKVGIEVIDNVDTKPFKAAIESEVHKVFIGKNGDDLVKQIDALAK